MTCNSEKIKTGKENKSYMLIKRKEKCCKIDVEGRAQFPVKKTQVTHFDQILSIQFPL